MDDKINLIDRQTMGVKQTKYSRAEISFLIFLGIAEFLALCEWIAAFIRNSHILGFWFGVLLFIWTAATITLLILSVKKGEFTRKRRDIFFGLIGFWIPILWFVICFLTVKIINYSQPNTNKNDLGIHDRFSSDWVEQVQKCSKITVQSRNEHTAIVKSFPLPPPYDWKGDSFYVQTSHTDAFLGLIVDGVYTVIPLVPQLKDLGKTVAWTGETLFDDTCTYVDCTKRIGAKVTECGDFEKK